MINTPSQYEPSLFITLLPAILSGLIAATAALIGVWLGNRGAMQTIKVQENQKHHANIFNIITEILENYKIAAQNNVECPIPFCLESWDDGKGSFYHNISQFWMVNEIRHLYINMKHANSLINQMLSNDMSYRARYVEYFSTLNDSIKASIDLSLYLIALSKDMKPLIEKSEVLKRQLEKIERPNNFEEFLLE
jgi:hypothetical protein